MFLRLLLRTRSSSRCTVLTPFCWAAVLYFPAVIVATVRALKMHGGGPPVVAGTPLPHAYTSPDVNLVKAGCSNLARHIQNTRKYGVPVVVAINQFAADSPGETQRPEDLCHLSASHNRVVQVMSGGAGAGA
jgi:formyltetrahydrofolate synthetase